MATTSQQEIIKKYEKRKQIREEYEQSRLKEVTIKANKKERYGKGDMLNLPRHRMYDKCADFVECPIDYKCHNFNPSYLKCLKCPLLETDDICRKKDIHHSKTFNMMISRERIDLDASE
ncbi:hypothetical protein KC480_05190 [Bacillus velezensis]|uniref:hypothetical protein n=1 Tax=Bacillus velezensis TaxID=492670 RepID=UPI001E303372|nr:hypothetical protein [Bacillus velezensis]MCD7910919.1 hypothetical protein [Bacillus velezensis]